MKRGSAGIVMFGDVVASRKDAAGSAEWLRWLVGELDERYGDKRIAPFGFTQGDELQGLLRIDADPLTAILVAALAPGTHPIRWAIVHGGIHAGRGPATERTGDAFLKAREVVTTARTSHDRIVIITGDGYADDLLADLTPALSDLLDSLTIRQREIAHLALIDGLRQSEVAERLNVRRATISVAFGRARARSIQHLVDGIRKVYASAFQGDGPSALVASPPKTDTDTAVDGSRGKR
jgi:DNA-binding CsgD family transcriptional regulator